MIISSMPANDPYRKNVYEPFKKLMQDKHGPTKEINLFHASSYDAIAGITEAMKTAQSLDRASIRDALEKVHVEGFLGPFAPTAADHQGAHTDPMRPMMFKNGQWIPYNAKQ
jgi:ABC-type branched-subunit amino acid transport system substrate-binding protein